MKSLLTTELIGIGKAIAASATPCITRSGSGIGTNKVLAQSGFVRSTYNAFQVPSSTARVGISQSYPPTISYTASASMEARTDV